ncbi:MAG: magnesium and cobalt exporter, family [Gaiellaceae bacterium]|nr:magnesium and cobalt exporter, family [Gaiellaceae bacterium]
MTVFLELAGVGVLILLNAFFVAAEYGLVTARRTRIVELQHEGNRRARDVLRITSDPGRFIAAMQLGVTLTSLGIGALGEVTLSHEFKNWGLAAALAIALAYIILTFFHVVIGELVPKGAALGHAEGTALLVSAPVRGFFVLFGPLIWFLRKATDLTLKVLGLESPGAHHDVHSEAELRMLLSRSTAKGEIEHRERELIEGVFDFGDKDVADVMIAKPDVVAISVDVAAEDALNTVLDSSYTRFPVYRETLDDIVGVLHVRDLVRAIHDPDHEGTDLESLLRPAYVVPESKNLAELLQEFRRTNNHFAVVFDEYGGMVGIVTLEDLLEEIVGEIEDEFDVAEEPVVQTGEDTYRVDGMFSIDDFNDRFGTELPEEDFNTVAGFVFGQLGRVGEPGDDVRYEGMRFDVLEVDGNRIELVAVTFEERPQRRDADADYGDDDEIE